MASATTHAKDRAQPPEATGPPESAQRPRDDKRAKVVAKRAEAIARVKRYVTARDLVRRGLCLLNARCYAQAAATFAKAQRLGPGDDTLTTCLLRALLGLGDARSSAAVLEPGEADEAGENGCDIVDVVRRALLLFRSGSAGRAIDALREALATHRDCAELHYQLGNILANVGEQEEAQMRFTLAVDLDPRHVNALINLALCHGAAGDHGRAVRLLCRARALRPSNARVGFLLACAAQQGAVTVRPQTLAVREPIDPEQSGRLADVIGENPEIVEAFTSVAEETLDADVFGVLADSLSSAVAARPEDWELRYQLAVVLERLGRTDEAIESARQVVAGSAAPVRALILLGRLYRERGALARAARCLERVLSLGAAYADVYLSLGEVYRDMGLSEQAKDMIERALEINADYGAAHTALATLEA